MATPQPQISAKALSDQLRQAATSSLGAAQAAQDAAQRLKETGSAFGPPPSPPGPSQPAQGPQS